MSGGIRDDASLERALGDRRRRGSTSAPPRWRTRSGPRGSSSEHGDLVAVGLDVRGTTLAARGWTKEGGDLWEVLARLDDAGCARYVVTDVTKDGTLRGPNLDLLREVCARTDAPVVASGGISSLDDLRALRDARPARRRGRDRRQGAVRGRVHAARGARRRRAARRRGTGPVLSGDRSGDRSRAAPDVAVRGRRRHDRPRARRRPGALRGRCGRRSRDVVAALAADPRARAGPRRARGGRRRRARRARAHRRQGGVGGHRRAAHARTVAPRCRCSRRSRRWPRGTPTPARCPAASRAPRCPRWARAGRSSSSTPAAR